VETPAVKDLVYHQLPTTDLIEIDKPVWTFNQTGEITPGDPLLDSEPKLNYRNGISTLGKLMAEQLSATIHRSAHITSVARRHDQWRLSFQDEREPVLADQVLITAPTPQAMALLAPDLVIPGLSAASYHAQFAFALGFEDAPPEPRPYHALLNLDRAHPIAWLSYENDKEGHVPAGQTVIIAQMAPSWTQTHYDTDQDEVARMIEQHVRQLQPSLTRPLSWWNGQRWRYAHPHTPLDDTELAAWETDGLFFAGDALTGKGRVHLALQSGLDVGARMA
jgi:predicted NAD/FAD-dependent oxidoreductase